MRHQSFRPFFWIGTVFLIISLACSAGQTTTPTPQPEPEPTKASQPEPVAAPTTEPIEAPLPPSGAVGNLEDVELAVIQIEAEGTFIDPEVGWQVNVGKRGTGFIISPEGVAVTNNHVVTGAALLRVWVKGDTKPRNARILGVSECSDLAVIQIVGAKDLPYLEWFQGDIKVTQDVIAAGFPLGDPEYTVTKGIVSKARADGETSWASVDYVIEHSAKINPGNSGGPLVNTDGKLIGINYAGVSATDQNFAISRDQALPIIDELREGNDVDSIGVNGGAVYGEVDGIPIYGVWVRSVAAGSPADKARIQAGDIIYQLQSEVLGLDGTMSDYCDILRTRRPSDTMDLTIIRFDDLSLLEGQLNGRELAVTGYFSGSGTSTDIGTSGDWVNDGCWLNEEGNLSCYDNTGTIYVEVPADWLDYNGGQWQFGQDTIGVAISSAPNIDDYNAYWSSPGLFFGASDTFATIGGYAQFLDYYNDDYEAACKLGEHSNYNDGLYRGMIQFYYNCGGAGGSDAYLLSAVSIQNQGAYIIIIMFQVPKGDIYARDLILDSFLVGEL